MSVIYGNPLFNRLLQILWIDLSWICHWHPLRLSDCDSYMLVRQRKLCRSEGKVLCNGADGAQCQARQTKTHIVPQRAICSYPGRRQSSGILWKQLTLQEFHALSKGLRLIWSYGGRDWVLSPQRMQVSVQRTFGGSVALWTDATSKSIGCCAVPKISLNWSTKHITSLVTLYWNKCEVIVHYF